MREMAPIHPEERIVALDALRGLALYGVLLVNLLEAFRVSLFAYLRTFHTEPGRWNEWVDVLVAVLVEQKAMVVFSFLFGVGVGVVSERAQARHVSLVPFLVRRYSILLGIGLVHLLLLWDGDILTEYSVAALVMIPLVRTGVRPRIALVLAIVLLAWWASPHRPMGLAMPSEATMDRLASEASRAYGRGSWAEIQAFRLKELSTGILPLLFAAFPRTLGLFLLGLAASRVVRSPPRRVILVLATIALPVGGVLSALDVLVADGRGWWADAATLSMGLGYVGAFYLACERPAFRRLALRFAPIGRMALTSYLTQSLVCISLFYGVGLGLMNCVGSALGVVVATGIFVAQMWASARWFERRRFGPVELIWRRLTYGRV